MRGIYCGKVADEPDTYIVGELIEQDEKYSIIYQKQELPFAKCCGVGYFSVWTDSLIMIYPDEERLKERLEFFEKDSQKLYLALSLASDEIFEAKEMLRSVGEYGKASLLDDSIDTYIRRAKYEIEESNTNKGEII